MDKITDRWQKKQDKKAREQQEIDGKIRTWLKE